MMLMEILIAWSLVADIVLKSQFILLKESVIMKEVEYQSIATLELQWISEYLHTHAALPLSVVSQWHHYTHRKLPHGIGHIRCHSLSWVSSPPSLAQPIVELCHLNIAWQYHGPHHLNLRVVREIR